MAEEQLAPGVRSAAGGRSASGRGTAGRSPARRDVAGGLLVPVPRADGLCAVCRGPSGRSLRCFTCDLHLQCAPGSLADVVVPVAFAVKGGPHASDLWHYKSGRAGPQAAERARQQLAGLCLAFLRDHVGCVLRAAGLGTLTHLAVVPSARGRPGDHPLRALIAPCLSQPSPPAPCPPAPCPPAPCPPVPCTPAPCPSAPCPPAPCPSAPCLPVPCLPRRWAEMTARPDDQRVRDLDPGRFRSAPVPGASVLLLDDTWVTGSSAQSAAMALRRAGAVAVATVVLGRHVGPGDLGPAAMPFRPDSCAVHATAA